MASGFEKRFFSMIALGFGAVLAMGSLLLGREIKNLVCAVAGVAIMAAAYWIFRASRPHRIGRWVKKN